MSPTRPRLPFEQPALPILDTPQQTQPSPAPPAPGRRHLAAVVPLRAPVLEAEAADVMTTLEAVGLTPDASQALALAAAGMVGLNVWTHPRSTTAARERAHRTFTALAADVARRRSQEFGGRAQL